MVINKVGKFALRIARNIAKLPTEEQRKEALDAVQPGSRQVVEAAVKAMLRNQPA